MSCDLMYLRSTGNTCAPDHQHHQYQVVTGAQMGFDRRKRGKSCVRRSKASSTYNRHQAVFQTLCSEAFHRQKIVGPGVIVTVSR